MQVRLQFVKRTSCSEQLTRNAWEAHPAASTNFEELKPQQTGTGLLIRYGEVSTTSGSTNSLPGRLTSRTSPFEGERGGANPSPAANHSPLAQNESGSLTN